MLCQSLSDTSEGWMAKRSNDAMRQWALRGAELRLLEIAQEAAAIYAAFPELRERGKSAPPAAEAPQGAGRPRRRRRQLSAEARQRISDAQKARWAKQKAGKKR